MGAVEVEVDGEIVTGLQPKTRAVLALLALDAGHLCSGDALSDALWGDDAPPAAATSLRTQVSRLRAALPGGAIETSGRSYRLVVGPGDRVDVAVFPEALSDAERARADGRLDHAERVLGDALALWRGDPFPELGDSPRAVAERRRLEEYRASMIEARAEVLGTLGRRTEAIALLESHCGASPYREEAWAQLMRLLAGSGRQADALAVYQRARTILVEQLGLEPGPGLRAAEAEILAADEGDAPVDHARSATAEGHPLRTDRRGEQIDDPMVGRAQDLAVTVAACRSRPGSTSAVLVDGPAGMGKTRLLEEANRVTLAEVVEGPPPLWLVGGCDDGLDLAFQPIVTALRSLPIDELAEHAGRLPLALRASLGRVLPELLTHDLGGSSQGTREGLFEAIRLVVDGLGRGRSTTIVMEDLHWCSPDTAELIRYLMASPPASGLGLVLSYRATDLDANHPLHDVITASRRRGAVEVSLGRLAPFEVGELVRRAYPALADEVVDAITDRSDGSPLFAKELAKDARRRGEFAVDAIPPGIAEVVQHRLQRMSPLGRRLVQTGSLIGPSFTLDVVAAVEGISEPEALDALEPALGAGLIAETSAAGRFVFGHALMQDAVAGTIASPTRHGLLMWRIGDAADRAYLLDHRQRIELAARALCVGADTGDPQRAVAAALDAGHLALDGFDASAALAAFDLALSVLDRCGDRLEDPALWGHRAEVGRSRAFLLLVDRGLQGAVDASRRALALVADRHDPALVLACIEVVDHCRAIFLSPIEAIDLCRAAADALPDGADAARAMVLAAWATAYCRTYTGTRAEVGRLFHEALALADQVTDDRARRWVYGLAHWSGADGLDLAFEPITRAYCRLGASDDSPQGRAMAAVAERNLAMCTGTGDLSPGLTEAAFDRAARVAIEQFDADFAARVDYARTGELLCAGKLDEVAEHLFRRPEDRDDLERVAGRLRRYYVAHAVGELNYHRDELASLVESTGGLVSESTVGVRSLNWSGGHALALADAGRLDDASRVLDGVLVTGFDDLYVGMASVLGWFTEAAWSCGHRDALDTCFDRLRSVSGLDAMLTHNWSGHGSAELWCGLAASGMGRADEADELLQLAADNFQRSGLPLYTNLASAFRSRLLLDGSRASRREATVLATEAADAARRVGQHRVTRLVVPVLAG